MPETPNHGYNVPNEGEQDWHVPLNENFEQYDTDIELRDAASNRGNYDPKDGAKFLATDTGAVYVGDGSSWNRIETTGEAPTLAQVNPDGEHFGVGRDDPITGNDLFTVHADYGDDIFGGMYVNTAGDEGWPFYGYASGGDAHAWTLFDYGEEEWILEFDFANPRFVLTVDSDGNLSAPGNKNFVQPVETDDGEREVVYTATEAPTPRTSLSGVAELEDGRAEVDLPDHFGWVTSDAEPIHVQTTPHSAASAGLAVVERSPDRLVVEDLVGEGDYEFSYTATGTREGYEDKEVVREPVERESRAVSPDGRSGASSDD